MALVLDGFKVGMDAIQDGFSGLRAVTFNKPLLWIAIVLAVIAAVYAMAQGNHVRGDSAGAIAASEWNPVVSGSRVKEAIQGALTYGTATIEVVEGKSPVGFSEVVGEVALASAVTMNNQVQLVLILPGIHSPVLALLVLVLLAPLATFGALASGAVLFLNRTLAGALLFEVARSPVTTRLAAALAVFSGPLAFILTALYRVAGGFSLGSVARLARRTKALPFAAALVEVIGCGGERFAALRTAFRIRHEVVSYRSYINQRCGQAVGLAFRNVDQTFLAHTSL